MFIRDFCRLGHSVTSENTTGTEAYWAYQNKLIGLLRRSADNRTRYLAGYDCMEGIRSKPCTSILCALQRLIISSDLILPYHFALLFVYFVRTDTIRPALHFTFPSFLLHDNDDSIRPVKVYWPRPVGHQCCPRQCEMPYRRIARVILPIKKTAEVS